MNTQTRLPQSDVSAGVGLAGLAGLLGWIALCHYWPVVAATLSLPGPRLPLAGPYAALAGLVIAALPMVFWSLAVDKVHRRASTGIAWDRPRPVAEVIDVSITKLAGLWATWGMIGAAYCLARWYWQGQYLFAMEVLGLVAVPLFVLSIPYVIWLDRRLVEPKDAAWHFGAMLVGRERFDRAEVAKHLRAWGVKGFFTAFMLSIVPPGFAYVVSTPWSDTLHDAPRTAQLLMELMFVVDVQIGTVGYILTMRPFDAQIRSANPYLAGWVAALACYPPFLLMGPDRPIFYETGAGGWAWWFAGNDVLLWIWAALLVALTAIYAWATFAFGIRFSNLTYRGVLTNGPYRWTRHPAYLSKNAFWWLTVIPFMVTTGSLVDALRNTFWLAVVSGIYFWRAKTEEKHLLGEDEKYRAYHAWMQDNALITHTGNRVWRWLLGRRLES